MTSIIFSNVIPFKEKLFCPHPDDKLRNEIASSSLGDFIPSEDNVVRKRDCQMIITEKEVTEFSRFFTIWCLIFNLTCMLQLNEDLQACAH